MFSGKQKSQPLQVVAKYSDGSTRVVNDYALYLTNNKTTADIDDKGLVTAGKSGDTFVFARFAKFTTGAEIIGAAHGQVLNGRRFRRTTTSTILSTPS